MKLLLLADCPPSIPVRTILTRNPGIDIIVTLGDLEAPDIAELAEITDIPKVGVYGNHCDGRYMEKLGIENLHLRPLTVKGLKFFGYQGCVKYKDNNPLMSTQEYCSAAMGSAPYADVLVTHCPPSGINDNHDPAHCGFDGLLEYVDRESPRYVFHGHTYDF